MATVHVGLTTLLLLTSGTAGLLALHLLLNLQRLGTATMPPLQYNDSTLRDFELLSAMGGLLLFTSFTALVAGYYESPALQTAVHVPLIMFTVLLTVLLHRWRRRY